MMLRAADNARLGFAIGLVVGRKASKQVGRQASRLLTGGRGGVYGGEQQQAPGRGRMDR